MFRNYDLDLFDSVLPKIFGNFNSTLDANDYYVKNENDKYVLELSVPGFKEDDIQITNDSGYLSIRADIEDNDKNNYWRKSFNKRFKLSDSISKSKISANLDDGILTLELPKKKEIKPSQIRIMSGTKRISEGKS